MDLIIYLIVAIIYIVNQKENRVKECIVVESNRQIGYNDNFYRDENAFMKYVDILVGKDV